MDRRKKIEFLFGVLKGTRSVNELMPIRIEDWYSNSQGLYFQPGNNARLSIGGLAKRQELDSGTLRIIHIHSDIPIAESEEEVIM